MDLKTTYEIIARVGPHNLVLERLEFGSDAEAMVAAEKFLAELKEGLTVAVERTVRVGS